MKEKIKLMTIVGTRPELIRLSEIIKKADRYFHHIFVHTGQNYDVRLNDIFYSDLGIRKPDYFLNAASDNLGDTIGNIIAKSYSLMQEIKPEALLVLGDTNSSLSVISAKRLKIPTFHMEAGNRCFDENLPEEINRRIVDHISDINLPYTEHARRYLVSEGIRGEFVYVTGSPMREVISAHKDQIDHSRIIEELGLEKKHYIVLSAHREENIDNEKHFETLMGAINKMTEYYNMPVIYSLHPRSAKFMEQRKFILHPLVKKMPPFAFTEYSALMKHSFCVVSDSGTLPEEAAVSHFPAVSIRTSTERPEALEKGCFIIGGITEDSLIQSVDMAVKMEYANNLNMDVVDYQMNSVSSTVIKIIQSCTEIVNNKVWRK